MNHRTLSIGLLIPIILTACSGEPDIVLTKPANPSPRETSFGSSSSQSSSPAAVTSKSPQEIPSSVRIAMPFATQAPLGNWDMPYQEACEEASLILVHHYLTETPLDPEIMDREILGMVTWEEERGLPADIPLTTLAEVARDLYGYDTEIIEGSDVTVERIKLELSRGNPVIVPLAGQDLGNPYYSGDGPPYHMLVINGFDATRFFTHDVGTRRGEYYPYRFATLLDAIHDWTGAKETIREGARRMMIVHRG